MKRALWGLGFCAVVIVLSSCGSDSREGFDADGPIPGSSGGASGGFDGMQGSCQAGGTTCVGNDVHECGADGKPGKLVKGCDATGEFCIGGKCGSGCDAAEAQASNVGCEFWAVDLDNEYSEFNDAAGAPWGLVASNFGATPANVVIEQNDAPLGAPPVVKIVQNIVLSPGTVKEITLPTREVDGSALGKDEGPGTFVSPNAFRVRSSMPIVVYQFNTLAHTFSNDASLLVPKNGLGKIHRVVGWPTSNPIAIAIPGAPPIAGIPDHSYVTVIGTQPATNVKVKLGGPIVGGGGIGPKNKGDIVEVTLNAFDVLNLESTGVPGDMSGTIVESSAPVAVFSGGERGSAPYDELLGMPVPPSYNRDNMCCTDHLEEQVLPVTQYGKQFVITRSPIRSQGWVEPDILRFMGVAAPTTVKTSLPAPYDSFTLQPGEIKDAWTTTDFVAEATEPLVVAQIIVSQGYTENAKFGGDPSLTIFPPVDQYRRDYLFNVPKSWQQNYVVVAAPAGAKVTADGKDLAGCTIAPAGNVAGKPYEARRCVISEGSHRMAGDAPFGIVAYGYGSRGSYAFIGGANMRKIYEPPPLIK